MPTVVGIAGSAVLMEVAGYAVRQLWGGGDPGAWWQLDLFEPVRVVVGVRPRVLGSLWA